MPQGNGNQKYPKAPKNKRPWVDRSGAQDSTPPPHKETRTCNRCGKSGHLKDYCKSKQNVDGVVLTSPVGSKSNRAPNQTHPNPKKHKPNGNRTNGNGQAPAAQAAMLGGAAAGEPDVAALLLAANNATNAQLDVTAAALRADAARVRFAANTK